MTYDELYVRLRQADANSVYRRIVLRRQRAAEAVIDQGDARVFTANQNPPVNLVNTLREAAKLLETSSIAVAATIGFRLGVFLFGDLHQAVAEHLGKQPSGLRIRIACRGARLAALPWESLYYPGSQQPFVSDPTNSIVREPWYEIPRTIERRLIDELNFVYVQPDACGDPLPDERDSVRKILDGRRALASHPYSQVRVLAASQQTGLLHIHAHGHVEATGASLPPPDGKTPLTGDEGWRSRVVVLSACNSATEPILLHYQGAQDDGWEEPDEEPTPSSITRAVATSDDVIAALGYQSWVQTTWSKPFMDRLYSELATTGDIERAVASARGANGFWFSPVLYLDSSDGQVLNAPDEAVAALPLSTPLVDGPNAKQRRWIRRDNSGRWTLRDSARAADLSSNVVASPDGAVVASQSDTTIAVAWVNRFTWECADWQRGIDLNLCKLEEPRLLAVATAGKSQARFLVRHRQGTTVLWSGPDGTITLMQNFDFDATAGCFMGASVLALVENEDTPTFAVWSKASTGTSVDELTDDHVVGLDCAQIAGVDVVACVTGAQEVRWWAGECSGSVDLEGATASNVAIVRASPVPRIGSFTVAIATDHGRRYVDVPLAPAATAREESGVAGTGLSAESVAG